MIVADMLRLLGFYIDDAVDNQDAVLLFNVAQNKMATEIGCRFPALTLNAQLDDSPVYDEEYHELPILYAAAMYKAQDSSIGEKNSFMIQFESGLQNFVTSYVPPVYYLNTPTTQQFVAVDGQNDFEITKDGYSAAYGKLKVYVNGKDSQLFSKDGSTFSVYESLQAGDKVTAVWELNADFTNKPAYYVGW